MQINGNLRELFKTTDRLRTVCCTASALVISTGLVKCLNENGAVSRFWLAVGMAFNGAVERRGCNRSVIAVSSLEPRLGNAACGDGLAGGCIPRTALPVARICDLNDCVTFRICRSAREYPLPQRVPMRRWRRSGRLFIEGGGFGNRSPGGCNDRNQDDRCDCGEAFHVPLSRLGNIRYSSDALAKREVQ